MLERKVYRVLDQVFPCSAAVIEWSTVHKMSAAIARVHTHYDVTVFNVTGKAEKRFQEEEIWGGRLRGNGVEVLLVETFDKHYHSGLYTLKYHSPSHKAQILRKIRIVSVLDGSPC